MDRSTLAATARVEIGINTITARTTSTGTVYERARAVSSYPQDSVIADISITWGRQGLFEPPRARTARITVLPTEEWTIRRMLMEWPMQTMRIHLDGMTNALPGYTGSLIFEGNIDALHVIDIGGDTGVEVSCTETFGLSSSVPFTDMTIPYPVTEEATAADLANKLAVYAPEVITAIPRTWPDQVRFHSPDSDNPSIRTVMETLAAWTPLSFPSWSPDHKELRSTWSGAISSPFFEPLTHLTIINDGDVITDDDDITTDVRDWPQGWEFAQGDRVLARSVDSAMQRYRWHRGAEVVRSSKTIALDTKDIALPNELVFVPTIAAMKAQITSARRFRFRHKVLPYTSVALWSTWEDNRRRIRLPDDPVAAMLGITPDFVPIGGTIRITGDDVIHDVSCLWVEEWKPNPARPTWTTMERLWGTYTEEWSNHQ